MSYYSFEDIKQLYVNNFSETHGVMLAKDYTEFVDKVLSAIMTAMNTTPEGKEFTELAKGLSLRNNDTPEEWQKTKVNILTFLFWLTMDLCPAMKHEMATHLYNELRKQQ